MHDGSVSVERLRAARRKLYRQGGGTRPEVSAVEYRGGLAILKDYSRCDPNFGRWIGPLSARREARALEMLHGVRGVPRLLGRPARNAVLMGLVDGTSVEGLERGSLGADFFERFERLIEAIHRRGIAHCDLRSRGNILLGADGQPYIVDFVAHFKQGEPWNPLTRWMFRKFCEADRTAVARLKKRFAPQLLTETELAAVKRDRHTPLGRTARAIGKSVRHLSRWLLTRGPG